MELESPRRDGMRNAEGRGMEPDIPRTRGWYLVSGEQCDGIWNPEKKGRTENRKNKGMELRILRTKWWKSEPGEQGYGTQND